jgi:hypothetical protein
MVWPSVHLMQILICCRESRRYVTLFLPIIGLNLGVFEVRESDTADSYQKL